MRTLLRFATAIAAQGALFLAQSYLVYRGEFGLLLELVKYCGLLSLVFFVFDGNSGLVHSLARGRGWQQVPAGFLLYRLGVVAFLLPAATVLLVDPAATLALLPYLAAALALRLPWLDGPWDARGLQHWSLLLNFGWMPLAAMLVVLTHSAAPQLFGIAIVLGALLQFAVRLALYRPGDCVPLAGMPPRAALPMALEICRFMGHFGLGQIYGRGIIFAVGALFPSATAALALYAKQLFNAAGIVVAYVQRLELGTAPLARDFRLADIRLTLLAQALIALAATAIVLPVALPLLGLATTALVLLWQLAEKLAFASSFVVQLLGRHRLAYLGLALIALAGTLSILLASHAGDLRPFLLAETAAFLLVAALGAHSLVRHRP